MSSYFLSMNPRKWIRHVSANLVVVLRRFHSAAAAHGATRTHSLTEFGFLGFEERSGQEKKDGGTFGKQRLKCFSNGGMADRDPVSLPAEVRAKLAELELELSEGEYLDFSAQLACFGPALSLPGAGVKGSVLGGSLGRILKLASRWNTREAAVGMRDSKVLLWHFPLLSPWKWLNTLI